MAKKTLKGDSVARRDRRILEQLYQLAKEIRLAHGWEDRGEVVWYAQKDIDLHVEVIADGLGRYRVVDYKGDVMNMIVNQQQDGLDNDAACELAAEWAGLNEDGDFT